MLSSGLMESALSKSVQNFCAEEMRENMNTKRAVALVVLLVVSACGGSAETNAPVTTTSVAPTTTQAPATTTTTTTQATARFAVIFSLISSAQKIWLICSTPTP